MPVWLVHMKARLSLLSRFVPENPIIWPIVFDPVRRLNDWPFKTPSSTAKPPLKRAA
jgi:hypothetical protein